MSATDTFLAPGQRYRGSSVSPWQTDLQMTILAVMENVAGPTFVTYRSPLGSRVTALAAEVEDALVQGRIIPVTGDFAFILS